MNVICKRGTKRLIKGHRYTIKNLWNDGTNRTWLEGKLEIEGVGKFNVTGFTDTDGNDLPKISIIAPVVKSIRVKFSDLKIGDILICDHDRYKTMVKGAYYRIEKLESVEYERITYNGNTHKYTDNYIRFEGIKRRLIYNDWLFRGLSNDELREINLNRVLNNEEPKILGETNVRKLEYLNDKDKALIENLAQAILDKNRHHLSVIEWACQKTGEKLGIKIEDYYKFRSMTLDEILNYLETKNVEDMV
jgi:hypothetical protein